eukprot:6197072-Pleurochrysis_carterae.AAC.1
MDSYWPHTGNCVLILMSKRRTTRESSACTSSRLSLTLTLTCKRSTEALLQRSSTRGAAAAKGGHTDTEEAEAQGSACSAGLACAVCCRLRRRRRSGALHKCQYLDQ